MSCLRSLGHAAEEMPAGNLTVKLGAGIIFGLRAPPTAENQGGNAGRKPVLEKNIFCFSLGRFFCGQIPIANFAKGYLLANRQESKSRIAAIEKKKGGLMSPFESVELNVHLFLHQSDLVALRLSELEEGYDPVIRELYYQMSEKRKQIGSMISLLRVGSLKSYIDLKPTDEQFTVLRDLDFQLQQRMVFLQNTYLVYLRKYQNEIFSTP